MRILHTSDWHLGRTLYGRKRYEEFSAFLDWLLQTIDAEKIDALLVAGDVFDTSTPGNRAQELYYRFLCRVAASCCRHVVIIAGNHDSPSFLNAPKDLLRHLNVHVVGALTDDPADEVILLKKNPQQNAAEADEVEAIICAVPYLRDKDIRSAEPGETIDDKNRKLVEGVKSHYAEVVKIAEHKRKEIIQKSKIKNQKSKIKNQKSKIKNPQFPIPVIAMGHLFTAGGKTLEGDGVRELYVGSLAHIGKDIFPAAIDYLALGHLHIAQTVAGCEHIRYCGSPIPMGFGEARQQKKIIIVETDPPQSDPQMTQMDADLESENSISEDLRNLWIEEKVIPCFQELIQISGTLDEILEQLACLKESDSHAWLEIEYRGTELVPHLTELVDEAVAGSPLVVLRIKNRPALSRVIDPVSDDETLDDLDHADVFARCLDAFEVPDEDRDELTVSYNEIIKSLHEEDVNAE